MNADLRLTKSIWIGFVNPIMQLIINCDPEIVFIANKN